MEENKAQTPSAESETPKVETGNAPAATSTPSTTPTNNKPLIIGGILIAVLAVIAIAVAAVLIISNQNQTDGSSNAANNGGGITALDPSNPEEAVNTLNTQFEDAALLLTAGDISKAEDLFGEFSDIDSASFSLIMDVKDATGDIVLSLDGQFETLDDGKVNFEGTLGLSGSIPDFGDITNPVNIEFKLVDEVLYFNLNDLPAEFAELLPLLGISEGAWYSLPADQQTLGLVEDTASSSISSSDAAELEQLLAENDLFVNARETDNRTIDGVETSCMLTDINPEALGDESTTVEGLPLEICSPDDALLPLYFGISGAEEDADVQVGFSINSLGDDFDISAPAGAQDIEQLLNLISGS
jgi:hypothetical protein